jgi:transcription antitermination protein NusB
MLGMNPRSRARMVALQLLFQHDVNRDVRRATIETFVKGRLRDKKMHPFALALYDGVVLNQAEIDDRLTKAAENWRLKRMAIVDRNVLRLGAFEMAYQPEPTPSAVALDEAIELARRFGTVDSPSFVNGVLDRVLRSINEPAAAIEPVPEVIASTEPAPLPTTEPT